MIPSVPIPNRGEVLRASWARQIAGAVNSLSALANNGGAKWTNLRDRRGGEAAVQVSAAESRRPFELGDMNEDGKLELTWPYLYLGSALVKLSDDYCWVSPSGLVALKVSFDDISVSVVSFLYSKGSPDPIEAMIRDQNEHKKEYCYLPLYLFAAPDKETGEESGAVVLDLRFAPGAHIWDN